MKKTLTGWTNSEWLLYWGHRGDGKMLLTAYVPKIYKDKQKINSSQKVKITIEEL